MTAGVRRKRISPSRPPRSDFVLILAAGALVTMGIVELASITSAKVSLDGIPTSMIFRNHLVRVVAGCIAFYAGTRISPSLWATWSKPLLIVSLTLLFLPGLNRLGIHPPFVCNETNGAYRSLCIGTFSFMPGELFKLPLILWIARFLTSGRLKSEGYMATITPLIVLSAAVTALLLQPSFSTSIGLSIVAICILFLAGVKRLPVAFIVFMCVLAGGFIFGQSGYRNVRLREHSFSLSVDPRELPYHPRQSIIGLGCGGMWGAGLGQGRQPYGFLPEIHSDYPLSAIGEEMGFAGTSIVILFFCLILFRGFAIARNSMDSFSFLVACGLTLNITVFGLINVGVATAVLPPTGQVLPFVSYGGASTMTNLLSVGILDSIHRSNQ